MVNSAFYDVEGLIIGPILREKLEYGFMALKGILKVLAETS